MGGFYIDVFAVYLYKVVIRTFEYIESIRWRRATASIIESVVKDPDMGHPSVTIRFQIDEETTPWVIEEEIPFVVSWDATRFAQNLPPHRKVIVRVHPDYRTHARFYRFDQKSS